MLAMLSVGAMAAGYLMMNLKPSSSNVSGDVCTTLFGSVSILTLTTFDMWVSVGPKDGMKWPEDFPPAGSQVTITGRFWMVEETDGRRMYVIPRLFGVEVSAL